MVSFACANCLLFKTCILFRAIFHSTTLEGGSWLHARLAPTGSSFVRPGSEPEHSFAYFQGAVFKTANCNQLLLPGVVPPKSFHFQAFMNRLQRGPSGEQAQFAGFEARSSRTSFSCKATRCNSQSALRLLYSLLSTGKAASCHHDAASLVKRQSHGSHSLLTPIAWVRDFVPGCY